VSVWFFSQDVSEIDAARITKLDREMFHDAFWKSIYFEVIKSKVKVKSPKRNIASIGLYTLVSAGFF